MLAKMTRIVVLVVLASRPFLASAQDATAKPEIADGVIAIVNDRHVLLSDVRRGMAPAYATLSRTYRGKELEEKLLAQQQLVLRALVDRQLVLTCYDPPAEEMLAMMVEDREVGTVKDKFDGDRSAFLAALTLEHMSIEDWRNNSGDLITYSYIRRREMGGKVVVSPLAIRQYYEHNLDDYKESAQVKLSMIVLTKAEDEEQLTLQREQVASLRKQLAEGTAFGELAKKFSQDSKAESGGDWGWVAPGDLKQELATAAILLDTGEVSDVVEAGAAFYLLKVEGRREERVEQFQDVRDDIRRRLLAEQQSRIYDEWIDRLKNRSYVKVIDLDSE